MLPLSDALAGGFFWNLPEFSRRIRFYVLNGVKRVSLRHIFRTGRSWKTLGARSRVYGGWVMTGMLFSARNCCTSSDVWFGASSCCRNHTEQTSHWQVSSSNRWAKSHEWVRERCQRLVPTPLWSLFDYIESVVALFQSEEFRERFDCPKYKGCRCCCVEMHVRTHTAVIFANRAASLWHFTLSQA